MMKTRAVLPTILVFIVAVMLTAAPAFTQQTTGVPGSPGATTTIDGKQLPPPPPKFGGVIKETARGFEDLVAATRRAAQGRAQRAAHHDRRPGLWRQRHVRRRHPDAGAGPDREGGAALHAVQLHRAVLADAGGADHRPQPPLRGLRRDHGAVDGLSRAMTRSSVPRTRPSAGSSRTTAMPRRGSARTTTRRASSTAWRAPSTNGRRGWASTTSTASWAARPTSGRLTCSGTHPDLSVGRQARLQPHHRHGGRGDQRTCTGSTRRRPTSRSSSITFPAAAHSPHHPKKEWIDKFKGKFDMGWNVLREQIFANQKRLGVIPANAKLTDWPDEPAEVGNPVGG